MINKTKYYPETKRIDTFDDYFGVKVYDPYQWLEDNTSFDTRDWTSKQNKITDKYLSQIPFRETIKLRLKKLWNHEKISAPSKEGNYTYYSKNSGLQNQSVIYRENQEGKIEVFLDPNTLSSDGTTLLTGITFSKDGSLVAYQISEKGSDWHKIIVWKAEERSIVGDALVDVKFSGLAWKGNEGFFYSRYDRPNKAGFLSGPIENHKLYFHKVGTPQSADELIFGGDTTARRFIFGYITEDERYLVINASNTTNGNELYLRDLSKDNSRIIQLVNNFEKEHRVVYSIGDTLFIQTNLNAPNNKLVMTNIKNPEPSNWKDLIPETENVASFGTGGGKLFANYLKDAASLLKQFDHQGREERIVELPGIGTVHGSGGKQNQMNLYYSFTSYIYPSTIFKYDILSGKSEVYRKSNALFNPEDYDSKQIFYTSKDGTKIPMILTHKKGLILDGENPVLLNGYGGFNVSLTSSFSLSTIILLEQGGIYAAANLRGGGEYGEKWYIAGTKFQKQNVFDDFISAAEYLIRENYTSNEKLAISGGSNGGLLVGAAITQRPDLFKVAFLNVGVLDMLRYHKFTAGTGWARDYGTAEESKEMFEYLYRYSPYHALKTGVEYPATMLITADHDDRVIPAHSFKFAARLQDYNNGDSPILIRTKIKDGHSVGKSTAAIIQEESDKWSFMFHNMGIDYKD